LVRQIVEGEKMVVDLNSGEKRKPRRRTVNRIGTGKQTRLNTTDIGKRECLGADCRKIIDAKLEERLCQNCRMKEIY
jgi:hypothetical protein